MYYTIPPSSLLGPFFDLLVALQVVGVNFERGPLAAKSPCAQFLATATSIIIAIIIFLLLRNISSEAMILVNVQFNNDFLVIPIISAHSASIEGRIEISGTTLIGHLA